MSATDNVTPLKPFGGWDSQEQYEKVMVLRDEFNAANESITQTLDDYMTSAGEDGDADVTAGVLGVMLERLLDLASVYAATLRSLDVPKKKIDGAWKKYRASAEALYERIERGEGPSDVDPQGDAA